MFPEEWLDEFDDEPEVNGAECYSDDHDEDDEDEFTHLYWNQNGKVTTDCFCDSL